MGFFDHQSYSREGSGFLAKIVRLITAIPRYSMELVYPPKNSLQKLLKRSRSAHSMERFGFGKHDFFRNFHSLLVLGSVSTYLKLGSLGGKCTQKHGSLECLGNGSLSALALSVMGYKYHSVLGCRWIYNVYIYMCSGLNSHCFPMVWMVINPIVGFYMPIIRTTGLPI